VALVTVPPRYLFRGDPRQNFPVGESAELPIEARTADQLPDEVETLMGLAERIDRHDIRHGLRVVDPRGDPGLAQEPLQFVPGRPGTGA
jgi:hypothetical protein